MTPTRYDITIYQGATWRRIFTIKNKTTNLPIDITGCSIRAQIRKKADATPIIIDMNTPDEITLTDPSNGQFRIYISDDITSAFPDGDFQWDLFIEWTNGDVDKIWYGDVVLDPNITEPSTN